MAHETVAFLLETYFQIRAFRFPFCLPASPVQALNGECSFLPAQLPLSSCPVFLLKDIVYSPGCPGARTRWKQKPLAAHQELGCVWRCSCFCEGWGPEAKQGCPQQTGDSSPQPTAWTCFAVAQAQLGLASTELATSIPPSPPPSSPKARRGKDSSQQQMTFSTETDVCFSQRVVLELSLIPPLLIVTAAVISIAAFPPDFRCIPAAGTLHFSPAQCLQKASLRPVLPGNKCSFPQILEPQNIPSWKDH